MLSEMDVIKFVDDIAEIQRVFDHVKAGYPLDRKKAEDIIRKHNASDPAIAAYNSPMLPGFVTFQQATDQMLLNNLNTIQAYLSAKMIGKSIDERTR